ncbi:MAG: N-succinyl-L-ornithine transcarbamylase [Cyclobacteriaceae bacterium]|jgi:N-succinyl-L-ornithine transcarbamylase
MNNFLSVKDVLDVEELVQLATRLKTNPHEFEQLGRRKMIGLIFFNPSLRTRMSMLRAASLIGLDTMVLNISDDGWKIETRDGVVMDGDTAEHIDDAIPVMSSYCDLLAFRLFPTLTDRVLDYEEKLLLKIEALSKVPVINMESATVHPLQSLADLVTIREYSKLQKPKIVLSWAPHPRKLPQAVANSFMEWTLKAGMDITVVQPKGFELHQQYTKGAEIMYDQKKAFEGADFIYVKNWSSYSDYGKTSQDKEWMITLEKLKETNNAKLMHCLPVRRNVVISDQALDSPHSIVTDQASNRVCSAQAVLTKLLQENGSL